MTATQKHAAIRSVVTPAFAGALTGCAVVDEFSGRAVPYSLQAEEAQNQGLLLNLVRASFQQPLHASIGVTVSAPTQFVTGAIVGRR